VLEQVSVQGPQPDHVHCTPDAPFTPTPYAVLKAGLTQKSAGIKMFPTLYYLTS